MRYLAGLLLLVCSIAASAQAVCPAPARDNVCVNFTVPTTNTDGTTISTTAAKEIRVYKQSGTNWSQVGIVPWTQGQYWQTGLAVGTHTYRMTAVVAGIESAPSNVGSKTVAAPPPPVPNPPVISVQDALAYEIYMKSGALTARAVGAVPLGTLCHAETQRVGTVTYNRIAADRVDHDVRPNEPGWRTNAAAKRWARCS